MSSKLESSGTDRLGAFSDAVVAVVITLMALELKAPESASPGALWPLWPTAVSYAVSYLFIAIAWINHHHLVQLVRRTTPRLIWSNFAHLFVVSLVPFSTAWIARTELAAVPVAFYAGVFVCVNLAYRLFERDVFAQADERLLCKRARRMARRRSAGTLLIFAAATAIAPWSPVAGFLLVCSALVPYLRPEAPAGAFRKASTD